MAYRLKLKFKVIEVKTDQIQEKNDECNSNYYK